MKKAKTLLAVIAMVMSCFILLGPAEAQAAKKKDYVINITKTTPKAAEKKLRKIKGSDKRQLIFRVKARNPKDAYKKTKAWLTKFQKLSANVYGVLPSMLDKDDVELFDEDEDVKGYYTYVGDLVSDYSNMNTICKRAVTDGARQYAPGRYLLSDYESKCMLSYGNLTHPQIRETVDMEDALFDSQVVERIRKNGCTGTKNAKTVKKQSDSFRVQFFVNNLSGITLDSTLHFLKQGTLYAVAKKKCNLPAHQVANVVEDIINHLTMDCEMPEVLTGNLTRRIWRARRSDGQWDYLGFEGNKYKIEITDAETALGWVEQSRHNDKKFLSGLKKYVKKKECSEMDKAFLKAVVSNTTEAQIKAAIESYIGEELEELKERSEITYTLTNNNKEKYGMATVTGSFLYVPEEEEFTIDGLTFVYKSKEKRVYRRSGWTLIAVQSGCSTLENAKEAAQRYVDSRKNV